MDFFCVFSANGSLASYRVQREGEGVYKAVLRSDNGQRDDLPAEIWLQKEPGGWQASPPHDEITSSLVHALEANGA
ncbi:hypothetical protein [Flavisolibacter nicotianae]|uniref:hypothetical protein n=1 Tax=Flavisolibacter nicotianae TaxID=2364882 RepID=UPI0013C51806|nr:hypothetical protein [Flavisolibacter nicotianae]